MAYGTAKINLAQSAENAAAVALAGMAQAGLLESKEDALDFASDYATGAFIRLEAQWEESPVTVAAVKETPVARVPEVDDNPGDTVFNFGWPKGKTIKQVLAMDEAEAKATAEANGKDYTKSGKDYIEGWLLKSNKSELGFMKKQAQAYIDSIRAGI